MLRVIIRRKMKDQWNGLETDELETVDIDSPELERILCAGGMAENGYDHRTVAGVEVLPESDALPVKQGE